MQALLFGWMVGDVLGRLAFSRAIVTLALWCAVAAIGHWLGSANLSRDAAAVTGLLAPAALLGWTLWRPATSRIKLWSVDGLYLWAGLGLLILAGKAIWRLIAADGHLLGWLEAS